MSLQALLAATTCGCSRSTEHSTRSFLHPKHRNLRRLRGRAADTANGGTLYNAACTFCHGPVGEGGAGGVTLTNATNLAAVMQQVREGLNAMPPFGAALTPDEIQDVSAYVVEELPH